MDGSKFQFCIFLGQILFQAYALTLAQQLGIQGVKTGEKLGVPINQEGIEHLRDEQIVQLYELMKEATQQADYTSKKE